MRLLSRTTRNVAPTDAGRDLLAQLRPALAEVHGALEKVAGLRNKPYGRVRLLVPRSAAGTVLAPKLGEFAHKYPEVVLDVTTDDSRMDIVAAGFDAGIHFGEYIERDMIAVRVSADHKPVIVGFPLYLKSYGKPKSPRDLLQHRCINFRHGDAGPVPMGVREGQEVTARRGERSPDRRRPEPGHAGCAGRCRSCLHV
jgi:DNA-binding transcriptional LysR family regulator